MKEWLGKIASWVLEKTENAKESLSKIGVHGRLPAKLMTKLHSDSDKMPLRTFVWTQEEAEAAWEAQRIDINLALLVSENHSSVQTCAARSIVDGEPASVVVCINESVKRWILQPTEQIPKQAQKDKSRETQRVIEQQRRPKLLPRLESKQRTWKNVQPTCAPARTETWSYVEDHSPVHGSSEIHCINCHMTKTQIVSRGDIGPCCTEPFWTVPYELIFRSLPGGEDR